MNLKNSLDFCKVMANKMWKKWYNALCKNFEDLKRNHQERCIWLCCYNGMSNPVKAGIHQKSAGENPRHRIRSGCVCLSRPPKEGGQKSAAAVSKTVWASDKGNAAGATGALVVIIVPVVSIVASIAVKAYWCIEVADGNPVIAAIPIVWTLIAAACTAAFMTAAALMKTHNSFLRILGKLCPVLIIYDAFGGMCA